VVSDIAIFVMKWDVKLQPTNIHFQAGYRQRQLNLALVLSVYFVWSWLFWVIFILYCHYQYN